MRTNADKLVALVTELCDNVRNGLLSAASAADAIAAAGSTYVPDPAPVALPVLDLSDNGGIFCGYVDGTVPTMVDCARAGCTLCQGELDIACDDSWMEAN